MLYTVLKLLLFALTALFLGILLGRWWIRRSLAAPASAQAVPAGPLSPWDRLCAQLDIIDGGIEPQGEQTAPLRTAGSPAPAAIVQPEAPLPLAPPAPPAPGDERGLAVVLERISDLERYVRTLPRSQHQLDLSPIRMRLGQIEAQLAALQTPPGGLPTVRSPAADSPPSGAQTLPDGQDDLTRIRGVGPRLAALLAEQGVYYFWQIASWTPADIAFMDERLERFSGRIERDDWVAQAKQLASATGASQA